MPGSDDSLTLEGLARILRDHMQESRARYGDVQAEFAEARARDDRLRERIEELHREVGAVAVMVRDLAQIVARQINDRDEDRRYIREIFARMEQHDARIAEHDARFEEISRDIRRMLDAIERRGGNGGSRP